MARELKEKDDAARSSEAPKHVIHNANCESAPSQLFNHPYMLPNNNTFQHPSYSQGYVQSPYVWQQPAYLMYQHFAQHPVQLAVVSLPAQQEQ
jgi:hypothetical protein